MEGTELSSVEHSALDVRENKWVENRLPAETHTDLAFNSHEASCAFSKDSRARCGKSSLDSFSGENSQANTSSDLDFTKDVITLGERINNVNLCMEWIREELVAMRALDWSLKRQFHELNRQIQEIKVVVEQEEALHGGEPEVDEEGADKAEEVNPKKPVDSGYNSEENLSPLSSPRYFFEMTI